MFLALRPVGKHDTLAYLVIALALSQAILVGLGARRLRQASRALDEAAQQLRRRSPGDLQPLTLTQPATELMPLVVAVNGLLERIDHALASERSFTCVAAHELRTPLAAIRMQAQVALRTHAEHDRRQALERLLLSIDTTAHLIDQLLTMSRLDGLRALPTQAVGVQLDAIAAELIDDMRPIAAQRNQLIVDELAAARIEGLEFAIAALLRNLIDNALRYSPCGGTIRVRIGIEGSECVATIEDAGPGIAPEQHLRVFERFYRLPGTAHIDGCGIGLTIVQSVLEIHRARIALDRSELGGLRACVRFPAALGAS